MAICDRCGETRGVRVDDRCEICGPVVLCARCYADHRPNEVYDV